MSHKERKNVHKNNNLNEINVNNGIKDNINVYKCGICDKDFSSKNLFEMHNKNVHASQNDEKRKQKKNKKYRGRGKINKRDEMFSVFLVNIRGYRSKEVSFFYLNLLIVY